MFYVDNDTIYLSRGDTASFTVTATGYTFAAADRAVLSIKSSAGKVVYEKYFRLDTSLGNGVFLVELKNEDTDDLPVGAYSWDVRYVINPAYDSSGRIVDGDQVITPVGPQTLNLLAVVGEV